VARLFAETGAAFAVLDRAGAFFAVDLAFLAAGLPLLETYFFFAGLFFEPAFFNEVFFDEAFFDAAFLEAGCTATAMVVAIAKAIHNWITRFTCCC
jgi:hypothetical protein